MVWSDFHLELAAVRTDELSDAVPDVFAETDRTLGLEDATSVRRTPDVCAARVGDWVIVIDVVGRLSEILKYLAKASASTDLHLVRIADDPVALHYRDGEPVRQAKGLDACLEIAPEGQRDGEACAKSILHTSTGVSFGEDLGKAKFTLFAA